MIEFIHMFNAEGETRRGVRIIKGEDVVFSPVPDKRKLIHDKLLYIGKDGRDYSTLEGLVEANKIWDENRFDRRPAKFIRDKYQIPLK